MFTRRGLFIELTKQFGRAAITLLLAAIIIFFMLDRVAKISQSIREKRTAAFILVQRNDLISKIKNDLSVVGVGDAKIEEAIPKADNITKFVDVVEEMARKNGLEQQSLKFETFSAVPDTDNKEGSPKKLLKAAFTLNLSGGIDPLIKYLRDFEHMPYLASIAGLRIDTPNKSWDDESRISINGLLYVRE
ncbi:MAG: hypothetical protein HYR95_01095 [Candidatus Colwellbacteria bacterium]|nr:hypothetical protein [Candidatus Colwellbacteria bacterium]